MFPWRWLTTLPLLVCAACDSGSSTGPEGLTTPLWTAPVSHRSQAFHFVDGRIVVSDNGGIGAYEVTTGNEAWWQGPGTGGLNAVPFVVGGLSVFVRRGDTITALRARDGSRLWSLTPSTAAAAGGSDRTWAIVADTLLVMLEAMSGAVLESARLRIEIEGGHVLGADERGSCVGLHPAIPVRFAARLACFEIGGGESWYRRDLLNISRFVLTPDLVVTFLSERLVALDRGTGEEVWDAGGIEQSVYWDSLFADATRVYSCDDALGTCVALSLADGTILWRWAYGERIWGQPALGPTALYVPTAGGLAALDLATGAVRARIPPPNVPPELFSPNGFERVAYGDGIVVAEMLDLLYAYSAP